MTTKSLRQKMPAVVAVGGLIESVRSLIEKIKEIFVMIKTHTKNMTRPDEWIEIEEHNGKQICVPCKRVSKEDAAALDAMGREAEEEYRTGKLKEITDIDEFMKSIQNA